MKSKKMFLTSLVFGSMLALSAQAQSFTPGGGNPAAGGIQATNNGPQVTVTGNGNSVTINNPANPPIFGGPVNADYFYNWCDQVTKILTDQARLASGYYASQRYTEAKNVMIAAFQKALAVAQLPGTFRPYTHQEIARTIELLGTLDAAPSASASQHDNLIAYVALSRVDYVIKVKNELDRAFVIPCAAGCGHFEQNQLGAYQMKLAQVAGQQLQAVLGYSALPMGEWVYPVVDGNTFFTIVSKTSEWAAQDLAINLFSTAFSCAIIELSNVGPEAAQYQSFGGDRMAVRYIYDKVSVIAHTIRQSPYGCNGFPYHTGYAPGGNNYNQDANSSDAGEDGQGDDGDQG